MSEFQGDNHATLCTWVYHPSSFGFGNAVSYHPIVRSLLARSVKSSFYIDINGSLSPRMTTNTMPPIPTTRIIVIDDDPTGSQTVHGCLLLTRWDVDTLGEALTDDSPLFLSSAIRAA